MAVQLRTSQIDQKEKLVQVTDPVTVEESPKSGSFFLFLSQGNEKDSLAGVFDLTKWWGIGVL